MHVLYFVAIIMWFQVMCECHLTRNHTIIGT